MIRPWPTVWPRLMPCGQGKMPSGPSARVFDATARAMIESSSHAALAPPSCVPSTTREGSSASYFVDLV